MGTHMSVRRLKGGKKIIVQAAIWSTVYARWLTKITLTGTAILGLVYVKWIMRQVRISACFKNLMRFMHDGH
uniref:Uncharacterized protein n=1 Tax=Acrobeloides nanus TaxID=290746 RepID=A0A914E6B5_9BILA